MRRNAGSVSVFLALTITMMLSFCMVLIESARENTMLLKADLIFDTGTQCLLAEYHSRLWEDYDLFYIDCSYGTGTPDYGLVKEHLQEYIEKNLGYENSGWLGLDYEGTKISEVMLATDLNGLDFYQQAVEAAEASVGITYIEQLLQWLEQVESTYNMSESIGTQMQEAGKSIEEVNGTEVEVKEAVWGMKEDGTSVLLEEAEYETVDIDNPLEQVLSGNVLLRQVVGDYASVSTRSVDASVLASHRELAVGAGTEKEGGYSLWNKALFCKYVLDHFESYTDDAADKRQEGLQYELEYIIGGLSNDALNMEAVVAELLLIREIDNYISLLQNETKQLEAHSIAAVAASLVPWLEPIVAQAMLLYWAYEDSVADLQTLLRGGEVPLVKSLPVDVLSGFTLNYEEYLIILLLLQSQKNLSMRSIDLIELSVRQTQSTFRMDGCISQAMLQAIFRDNYKKEYSVTKGLQYY